jgi:hypothetical protein
MSSLKVITTFFNKQYKENLSGKILHSIFSQLANILSEKKEISKSDFYFNDDMLLAFRNVGFLNNPDFFQAFAEYKNDPILLSRIWRVWVVAWSVSQKWCDSGIFLDLGTYNGKTLDVALRFAKLSNSKSNDTNIYAIDMFENPPLESRKSDHSENLHDQVHTRLSLTKEKINVIKGRLPDCLPVLCENSISWAQIDLNSAEADIESFKAIYPYLKKSAIVIFDDYGASRYKNTQLGLDKFLYDKDETILELPTSQGLFIKR